jgi:glycosyltransferase involved in cell wall biosynthesis
LKVIDANDVQAMRVEALLERTTNPVDRLLAPWLVRRYREFEKQALSRADVVVATTARDAQVFRAMLPSHIETLTIPTGLDTDYFVPQPDVEPDPWNVVFYGALANPMNRDAVEFLVGEILPRIRAKVPQVRLTLVGSSPQPEQLEMVRRDPGITLTGYVEDVRRPLAQAAVVVCPLRFGYGIRGRIFELLAMQVPVVATSIAVAGMDLVSGDGLLLAVGAADFAAAVVDLLEHPERGAALAQRARALAVERMSIGATYDRLAEFLDAHPRG